MITKSGIHFIVVSEALDAITPIMGKVELKYAKQYVSISCTIIQLGIRSFPQAVSLEIMKAHINAG